MDSFGCHGCGKEKEELPAGKTFLRCSACHAGIYCSKECQKAAWKHHKAWCKHVVFCKTAAFDPEGRKAVARAHPRLAAARARLAVDRSDAAADAVEEAALAAGRFMQTLREDLLPDEDEAGLWGLVWQSPRSPPYQRLLRRAPGDRTWQMAEKYGDLTATQLFEALVQPGASASEALTRLLTQEVKVMATEEDAPDPISAVVAQFRSFVEGLKLEPSFDDVKARLPGVEAGG